MLTSFRRDHLFVATALCGGVLSPASAKPASSVIDPEPVLTDIREAADAETIDPSILVDPKSLTDACALALVEGTPIAYLPQNLVRAVPGGP